MVIDEPNAATQPQFASDLALQPQLPRQPIGHRREEPAQAARRGCQRRDKQPLKLHQRLFIEDDVIDFLDRDARFIQAPADRLMRERRVSLHPREPLLLSRPHDATVLDQRCRRIVVVRRNAEDPRRHGVASGAATFGASVMVKLRSLPLRRPAGLD